MVKYWVYTFHIVYRLLAPIHLIAIWGKTTFSSVIFVAFWKKDDDKRFNVFCILKNVYNNQSQIDDLHISHNASGMEANIRVLLICSSSSHSSLVVNSLELPWLAATSCLYETEVTRVVRQE